jgi:hypothetical protein
MGEHGQVVIGCRPLIARAIPGKFDAVVIRIAQVNGFADAVV